MSVMFQIGKDAYKKVRHCSVESLILLIGRISHTGISRLILQQVTLALILTLNPTLTKSNALLYLYTMLLPTLLTTVTK